MSIVSQAVSASIGNSIAMETVDKNYQDFSLFNFLYMIASGMLAVLLFVLYQPFMQIWLGDEYLLPLSVVIALCLYFYVLKMGDMRAMYNDAAGLWWEQRYRTIAEAVLNIALNFLLIRWLGVLGVVLASLISLFSLGFLGSAYVTFQYYFGAGRMWHYLAWQGAYLAATVLLAALSYLLCEALLPQATIPVFIGRAGLSLLVWLAGNWLLWHRTAYFHQGQQFLHRSRALLHR